MNLFRQLKTYFVPAEQSQPASSPKLRSNSFELIVDDILEEKPSEDFIVLGEEAVGAEGTGAEGEQEGVENMYIKDFLLIGKRCEGRALTLEEWGEVIRSHDLSSHSKKDLYFSVFKGIDYRIRKDVWEVLANTKEMRKAAPLPFEELADPSGLPAGELDTIDKDVRRTDAITKYLPELRKVLVAYSRLSGRGYTQGMNLIGGILLRLLAIENDHELSGHAIIEEEFPERVFWVLVGVMRWKGWAELFERDLSGLQRMLSTLRRLMEEHVPRILRLIEQLEWDLGIFAQYYVTICLYNCPLDLAPIVLDLFLLDGEPVVHSLLLRMLVLNENTILAFKDESALMKYLKSEMLHDTYQKLLKNRSQAKCLEDFEINFLSTAF